MYNSGVSHVSRVARNAIIKHRASNARWEWYLIRALDSISVLSLVRAAITPTQATFVSRVSPDVNVALITTPALSVTLAAFWLRGRRNVSHRVTLATIQPLETALNAVRNARHAVQPLHATRALWATPTYPISVTTNAGRMVEKTMRSVTMETMIPGTVAMRTAALSRASCACL